MAELRSATAADAAAVAEIYLTSRAAALPTVAWAHGDDDVRGWVRTILIPKSDVTVAEQDGAPIGFVALGKGFVQQLYILPPFWRIGVGSELLTFAQRQSPNGLKLYCFQQNLRARAFYERHGFVAIKFADGQLNEEREPDVLYSWEVK